MKSSHWNNINTVEIIKDKAEEYILYLTAVANILLEARGSIIIGGIESISPDGKRNIYVIPKGVEVVAKVGFPTIKITHADGTIEESHIGDNAKKYFDLGTSNDGIAKVYRLIALKGDDWVNLYRIFELIRDDVGGESEIKALGWASGNKIDLFRGAANHPGVSGDDARHGVLASPPPSRSMDLPQARTFIKGLVHAWLEYKIIKINSTVKLQAGVNP